MVDANRETRALVQISGPSEEQHIRCYFIVLKGLPSKQQAVVSPASASAVRGTIGSNGCDAASATEARIAVRDTGLEQAVAASVIGLWRVQPRAGG
jgi:hypothetical protein